MSQEKLEDEAEGQLALQVKRLLVYILLNILLFPPFFNMYCPGFVFLKCAGHDKK